ncbi:hypothetical protein KCP70_12625 [Salmonella enterica subsp. enterica]|nr:hypothetical protein KCP70_12625 [Salmonella enterica subsp. enterica]
MSHPSFLPLLSSLASPFCSGDPLLLPELMTVLLFLLLWWRWGPGSSLQGRGCCDVSRWR